MGVVVITEFSVRVMMVMNVVHHAVRLLRIAAMLVLVGMAVAVGV